MPFDAPSTLVLRPDLDVDRIITRVTSPEFLDKPVPPRAVANLQPPRDFPPYAGRQHRPPHAERRIIAPDAYEPIRHRVLDQLVKAPVRRTSLKERRSWRWWRDRSGGVAIEFALIAPIAITGLLGAVDVSRMQYQQARLQTIAEEAADGWARGTLADASAAQGWAQDRAMALGYPAGFTASTGSCGHLVTGSLAWSPVGFEMGATTLSASGCAP